MMAVISPTKDTREFGTRQAATSPPKVLLRRENAPFDHTDGDSRGSPPTLAARYAA